MLMPPRDPERHREYQRQYRLKNRKKLNADSRKYHQDHRDKANEKRKQWTLKNPEKAKITHQKYHQEHREQILQNSKKYFQEHREQRLATQRLYNTTHKEQQKRFNEKWRKENQEKIKKTNRERQKFFKLQVFNAYSSNDIKCKNCGISEIHFLTLDHIHGRKVMGHDRNYPSSKLYRTLIKEGFPSGYQVLCFNCNRIKESERRNALPHSKIPVTIRQNRYNRKLKLDTMSAYSHGIPKCNCCGFPNIDALTMDHIKPRKEHGHAKSFGSHIFYAWLKKKKYPPEYQVLCDNCNSAKSDDKICPHQIKGIT